VAHLDLRSRIEEPLMENAWLIIAWAFIFLAVFAEVRRLRTERKRDHFRAYKKRGSQQHSDEYFKRIEEMHRDFE
jgi:hypothetical protein